MPVAPDSPCCVVAALCLWPPSGRCPRRLHMLIPISRGFTLAPIIALLSACANQPVTLPTSGGSFASAASTATTATTATTASTATAASSPPINNTKPPTKAQTSLVYGSTVELEVHEKVQYDDGLSIVLRSFSHKKPSPGGPTKATAYLSLAKGTDSGEIRLSIHGVEGKSPAEDGLSDSQRYGMSQWNEYKFELKRFSYGRSIEIKVHKMK